MPNFGGILEDALRALRSAGEVATTAGKERFSKLLGDASFNPLENKGLMREFPAGQLAIPDNVFDITQTASKLSQYPKQMPNTVLGQYDSLRNEVTYNRFSDLFDRPGYTSQATGTAPHEYLHALQNQPDKLVGTEYENTIKPGAEILGINKFLRGAQDKDIRSNMFTLDSKQPLDEDALSRAMYQINPLETSAARMSQSAQDAAGNPSLVKAFRESYPSAYSLFNKEALDKFKNDYPSAAQIAAKYTKDYLPAIGAVGTGATAALALPPTSDAAAPQQQVMSNVDKTGNDEQLPVIDPLGSFSSGLGGVGEVGKAVGDWGQGYAKGTGKVLQSLTGERKGREDTAVTATGGDWEKAINTASLFFNPAGKAGMSALTTGFDWINPSEAGADSTVEGKSKEELGTSRTTPYQERTIPEAVQNVALGIGAAGLAALAARSPLLKGEVGAINLKGFFSPLTNALEKGVVGKSVLSPKMTGEQVLKTLQSAGIKEDELVFSGVGDALTSIGKDRIGPAKMEELKGIAKKGALGFQRKDSPGEYSNYSLFSNGDPSFKNAVYTLPDVGFSESHFGEGVVAHRRFGDKEISTIPITSYHRGKVSLDDYNNQVKTNSLHLDEVQSQFYEKGSKFGHGSMKGLPEGVDPTNPSENYKKFNDAYKKAAVGDYSEVPEHMKSDMDRYVKLSDAAENVDRSNPQGFATALSADDEVGKIYSKYDPQSDLSVENAPLRGEKYVELLAKDHLRAALSSGKDAISWTPSEVQHERYYKNMKDLSWNFTTVDGKGIVNLLDKDGSMLERATDLDKIRKLTGNENSKAIISSLENGETEGGLGNLTKDVYQKLYDRAIPKAFEKLTGEKAQEGFVKGRNGEDVKINWIPLDKVKEKMLVPAKEPETYVGEANALQNVIKSKDKNTSELRQLQTEYENRHYDANLALNNDQMKKVTSFIKESKGDWRDLMNRYDSDYSLSPDERKSVRYKIQELKAKSNAEEINSKTKEHKQRLELISPKVKDLPIASNKQTAKEFFNA